MALRKPSSRQPVAPTSPNDGVPGLPNASTLNAIKPAPKKPVLGAGIMPAGKLGAAPKRADGSIVPVNAARMEQMLTGGGASAKNIANMPEAQWKQLLAQFGVFDG